MREELTENNQRKYFEYDVIAKRSNIKKHQQLFQKITVIRISEKLTEKYTGQVQFGSNYMVMLGKSTAYGF